MSLIKKTVCFLVIGLGLTGCNADGLSTLRMVSNATEKTVERYKSENNIKGDGDMLNHTLDETLRKIYGTPEKTKIEEENEE